MSLHYGNRASSFDSSNKQTFKNLTDAENLAPETNLITKNVPYRYMQGANSNTGASVNSQRLDWVFETPGNYTWICPAGISKISVLCIGGGGAGRGANQYGGGGYGGALAYMNGIDVTPGNSYYIIVGPGGQATSVLTSGVPGTNGSPSSWDNRQFAFGNYRVQAEGGIGGRYNNTNGTSIFARPRWNGSTFPTSTYGNNTGSGGGNGGRGGCYNWGGGAGGAGGYSGNGGDGSAFTGSNPGTGSGNNGFDGAGGGGGGGGRHYNSCNHGGGGGTGIWGEGTSGTGGSGQLNTNVSLHANPGTGGSPISFWGGGLDGESLRKDLRTLGWSAGTGHYGGGGAGSEDGVYGGHGGDGVVRICAFPTSTGLVCEFPSTNVEFVRYRNLNTLFVY